MLAASGFANTNESAEPIPEVATEWGSVAVKEGSGTGTIEPLATAYPPEGGTWSYGTTGAFGGGTIYSDYLHNSRAHGSTVVNADGVIDRSPVASAGSWSHAEAPAIPWAVDDAFYWLV